jgi:hypothetical protein
VFEASRVSKHAFKLAGNAEPGENEVEIGLYPLNAGWNVYPAGDRRAHGNDAAALVRSGIFVECL